MSRNRKRTSHSMSRTKLVPDNVIKREVNKTIDSMLVDSFNLVLDSFIDLFDDRFNFIKERLDNDKGLFKSFRDLVKVQIGEIEPEYMLESSNYLPSIFDEVLSDFSELAEPNESGDVRSVELTDDVVSSYTEKFMEKNQELLDFLCYLNERLPNDPDKVYYSIQTPMRVIITDYANVVIESVVDLFKDFILSVLDKCMDKCFSNPLLYIHKDVASKHLQALFGIRSLNFRNSLQLLIDSFTTQILEESSNWVMCCISVNGFSLPVNTKGIKIEGENIINLNDVEDISEDKDESVKFIDDYKLLNKLAENSGFVYDRSKGDHGIFKNAIGNIVIIPQGRTIGKGLSIKIQKSILAQAS